MSQHITERLQVFADARFRFDPGPHEYYLGQQQLTSFSRWIDQYTQPFIEAEAAPAYARRNRMSVEAVLALWAHNRWVGTMTHVAIENFWLGRPPIPVGSEQDHPEVQHRFTKFMEIYFMRLLELTAVGVELKVYCERLGICGTLDLLAQHPRREGLPILDWKTNGTFSTIANCYRKYMRGPFSDLLDCHETKYSLQNSFYRIILEEAGIPTTAGAMVHLPPGDAPAVIYTAIDYRQRIRSILF